MDNVEDRYFGRDARIYDRGYHDGAVDAKRNSLAKYDELLSDMVESDAYCELQRISEMERKTEVYEAWSKIAHYTKAICELVEAEKDVSDRVKMLARDIQGEVWNAYLGASDDYEEIREIYESFAEECRKSAERGRA